MTDLLRSASGQEPVLGYRTGPIETYTAAISRAEAITLSMYPEVMSISRDTLQGGPSDERVNRIIAGPWQTPGYAWQPTLPANTGPPYYWDTYLSQLTGLGLNLSNQVIGFVDTGVDSGLYRSGAYCPPFLLPPAGSGLPCRLVFTTDKTSTFPTEEHRADDRTYHGTMTTAIAAGFTTAAGGSRDAPPNGGYSFTQGVAQNAKVAICKMWKSCGETYRSVGEASPFLQTNYMQLLRYGLVEMGITSTPPDLTGANPPIYGPGARLFNHSWNFGSIDYEPVASLLDQTTRRLSQASFDFGGGQVVSGPSAPALHVVSAGNVGEYYPPTFPPDCPNTCPPVNGICQLQAPDLSCGPYPSPNNVTAPGPAKNVITVGATESYNPESYTTVCAPNDLADSPLLIGSFSRLGFTNQRLKPDLVAPGTRVYGPQSVEYTQCLPPCNLDSNWNLLYNWNWSYGTSFSAPAVTGAAAVTSEWLRFLNNSTPSPALVKATLIATARTLTTLQPCSTGCNPCGSSWGDMRPAPDKFQGWGGVALDHLFRPATNYYFYDQGTTLTSNGQYWSKSLSITDVTKDINIALVWTDRANDSTITAPYVNLVNDLDLVVVLFNGGHTYTWYGNNFYTSINSCARDGHSLRNPPSQLVYDRKNNVEKISINASDIPAGGTVFTVLVTAFSLTGDGIDPTSNNNFRQDFALMVDNAHQ